MTNTDPKIDQSTNTGFIFGLTLGAAIGALSAILVNKSDEVEVVQNFESKVKEFFQDLVTETSKDKKGATSKKIEFIDVEAEPEPEKPPVVIKRKTAPKMFVKPKR